MDYIFGLLKCRILHCYTASSKNNFPPKKNYINL